MEDTLSISEQFDWAQDPTQECAGMAIIQEWEFVPLSERLADYPEVKATALEIEALFREEAKRFAACGGNHADDRFAVIRRNPLSGWQYIINKLNVTGAETAPEEGETVSGGVIVLPNKVNLQVAKVVDDSTPVFGGNITFSLSVTNSGKNKATNVVLTDMLPSGYSYVSDTSEGTYDFVTGQWTIGELPVNETVVLSIVATVLNTGEYNNTATVSSTEPDSDLNTNSVTVNVVPVEAAQPDPLPPGTVPCESSFSESGGTGFWTFTIDFGTDIGVCGIDFNAVSVPDRAKLIWDGQEVADSGFVGSESYRQKLLDLGYTEEELNLEAEGGTAELRFNKTSAEPSFATITVDAPFGTYWTIQGVCVEA